MRCVPVELVLYPVAIHYKGSGFYTTDYGKGKAAKKDGEGGSSGGESKAAEGGKTDSKPAEKKAAASGDWDYLRKPALPTMQPGA